MEFGAPATHGTPAAPVARGADGDTEADFRVLGPVEVFDRHTGTYLVPSGSKQRALLGALVVRAGHVLSAERLIHELWGDRPPASAANALQAHVARLRRLLQGGAPDADGQEWIATRSTGYLLRPGRATTDAQRFHRLSAEGRAALGSDPEHAAELLRGALSLWRGPALEGSTQGPLCTVEADRLEELRLTTLETLYDANLRSGRHAEVVRDLERLTANHPMRERLYDLQMLALYRCGRQTEALGVYERARRRLVDELGVEPGPALRARMEAILRHAPSLAVGVAAGVSDGWRDPDAALLELGREIARLGVRIESLGREQEALIRRFNLLSPTPAAAPVPGDQLV
ncbi:AfsR/SARP family transcriptional regulator [Streptomyces sp. NBC_00239]|uniref:AfsR/SARP family transcriptional regulator n=1 Tax=Streptomyces sp. NBC_00239 TaxID=2903640 RepID=UPI002E27C967|nr:AfsR/SARP family transcriptional regulator [Streptomyces sp. NBC_00239]